MKYECKAFYTFWAAVNISVVNFIGLIRVIEGTFFFFFSPSIQTVANILSLPNFCGWQSMPISHCSTRHYKHYFLITNLTACSLSFKPLSIFLICSENQGSPFSRICLPFLILSSSSAKKTCHIFSGSEKN